MTTPAYGPIDPPTRLLMGPGPINADPRVLRAMSAQLVGQYDPWMTATMTETMGLYREVFRTGNEQTFLVDGTSRAGIEAALVSLLEPGDRVLVPVFGRFGHLLVEIAERCRAEVHTIEVPWGQVFAAEQVEDAVRRVRPKVLGIDAWPDVPRGQPWKDGVCRALGVDPSTFWPTLRNRVSTYADLQPELVGAVERLIDFVAESDG